MVATQICLLSLVARQICLLSLVCSRAGLGVRICGTGCLGQGLGNGLLTGCIRERWGVRDLLIITLGHLVSFFIAAVDWPW